MIRMKTKIGDVFFAKINDNSKKYLQYIVNDLTQLNSDVIRVFKKVYHIDDNPDLSEIINKEIDFYAHCVTKWGVKLGYWHKVGNIDNVGELNVLFRSIGDEGNQQMKISQNWWIWKINENQRRVGKLEGENQKAEIGSVIPPDSIVHRMQTGEYDFVYPGY